MDDGAGLRSDWVAGSRSLEEVGGPSWYTTTNATIDLDKLATCIDCSAVGGAATAKVEEVHEAMKKAT